MLRMIPVYLCDVEGLFVLVAEEPAFFVESRHSKVEWVEGTIAMILMSPFEHLVIRGLTFSFRSESFLSR